MTFPIILLVLSVLACAAAVFMMIKAKLARALGASIVVCAVIVGVFGGIRLANRIETRRQEYGYIYTALKYMEDRETDPAALYLKRVTETNGYELTAAQALLEQLRGNDTVAALRLSVLDSIQDGSEEQRSGITRLKTWQESSNDVSSVTGTLMELLPISGERMEELDEAYKLETGRDYDGGLAKDGLYLRINQSLVQRNWSAALEDAAKLVRREASARNRLLLGEVVADAKYNGLSLESAMFSDGEEKEEDDSWREEYDSLQRKAERIQDELILARQELSGASTEDEKADLSEQVESLTDRYEETKNEADNIFLERALSSIADIHSLEAKVVRARIYFAMGRVEEAVEVLRSAASSVQAFFSSNRTLVNSLKLLDKIYDTYGETGVDTPEFREQMQVLFGSVDPELVNMGLTPLVNDFTSAVVTDQKVYGSELYVVGMDLDDYPTVRVRLGGQDEAIEAIREEKGISLSDTHSEVKSYSVVDEEDAEGFNSIAFVVDISGSMGGWPLNNAKSAIGRFLDLMDEDAELSLVAFDNYAEVLVGITTNRAEIRNAANGMYDRGGTNITAGVQGGIDVLAQANGTRIMIMMTDGQSGFDDTVLQRAVDQDITIFTVGFGGVNDDLLQRIADRTGGQYIKAGSSDELINVYSSLQSLIGNTVTITYTVENEEVPRRYFYLKDGSGTTVRREYYTQTTETNASGIEITSVPLVYEKSSLEDMLSRDNNAAFQVYLGGTGLDKVVSASYGGVDCQITDKGFDWLNLSVPATVPAGILDLTLTREDGATATFRDMLAVGTRYGCWQFTAGDLRINTGSAYVLDDGTLILASPEIFRENAEGVRSVSVRLDGFVYLTVDSLPGEPPEKLALGESGTMTGRGNVNIQRNDMAYTDNVYITLLTGPMVLEFSDGSSRFVPAKEG